MNRYSFSTAAGLVLAALSVSIPAHAAIGWSGTRVLCDDLRYQGVKLTVEQLDKLLVEIRSTEKKLRLCGVDLSDMNLIDKDLNFIHFIGANFQRTKFDRVQIQFSDLSNADFSDADISSVAFDNSSIIATIFDRSHIFQTSFKGAELNGSSFEQARLLVVSFDGCALEQTNFASGDLQQVTFNGAQAQLSIWSRAEISLSDFRGAKLRFAEFDGSTIRESDFSNSNMDGVSLKAASFDPRPGGLPSSSSLGGITIDEHMHYKSSPLGLVAIRVAMKEAGRDEDERRVTYAIERQRTRELIHGHWNNIIEGYFRLIMFEWTTQYGLEPGRSLLILLGLIPVFALIYWFAIVWASTAKIWLVPAKDDVTNDKNALAYLLKERGLAAPARALQFSLLSAFQVGWRDLNVGNWLSRLQWKNYSFSATGWVRTISGFQSLASVYLLAIWALTFFGKPFG